VTLVAVGTTSITATKAEDSYYLAATASYVLNVAAGNPPELEGYALLGVVQGGMVTISGTEGILATDIFTDIQGKYGPVLIPDNYQGPLLVEVSPAPNSTFLCDYSSGCQGEDGIIPFGEQVPYTSTLSAVVPSSEQQYNVNLTPFTTAATERMNVLGGLSDANVNQANREMAQALSQLLGGVHVPDAIYTIVPIDLTQSAEVLSTLDNVSQSALLLSLLNAGLMAVADNDDEMAGIDSVIEELNRTFSATGTISDSGSLDDGQLSKVDLLAGLNQGSYDFAKNYPEELNALVDDSTTEQLLALINDRAVDIPLADAGADLILTGGGVAMLDGSASISNNDNPLSYRWERISEPVISFDTTAQNPELATPEVTSITDITFALVVDNGTGAISYSSDNLNAAVVNAGTGEVTIVGAGQAVITATKEADDNYHSATVTYVLDITVPLPRLTFSAPGPIDKFYGDSNFTNTVDEEGSITYTSSDTSILTVDIDTGEVKLLGVGMASITASKTQGAGQPTLTGSYSITVQRYNGEHINLSEYPLAYVAQIPALTSTSIKYDLTISGQYAYINFEKIHTDTSDHGLLVVDISDPSSPMIASEYLLYSVGSGVSRNLTSIVVSGNYAYVTAGNIGLIVVDITDPVNLVKIAEYDTSGFAYDMALLDHYVYVADGDAGVTVIDISTPANPTKLEDTRLGAMGLSIVDDYIYGAGSGLSAGGIGLEIIDISDQASPVLAGAYTTKGQLHEVTVVGEYAYGVASHSGGVQVAE
jgi:LVIVD repeat